MPDEPRFPVRGEDATRRTWLANERTWLAWLRTGLTALAVALATGKVVPALDDRTGARWPYVALGVGYAVLGIMLVGYGAARRREVEAAIGEGGYVAANPATIRAIVFLGVALGVATAIVLVID